MTLSQFLAMARGPLPTHPPDHAMVVGIALRA